MNALSTKPGEGPSRGHFRDCEKYFSCLLSLVWSVGDILGKFDALEARNWMRAPSTSSEIKYYHCFFWRLMCLMWKVVRSGSSTHQVHHQSLSPSTNTILLRCSLFMFDFFQNALVFEALNLNYFYSLCLLRLSCLSFWRM